MLRKILRLRRRRGAEAIEFALSFPWFMLLVMGGIEMSWFMGQNAAMYLALRHGAREGAVNVDEEAVVAAEAAAQAEWSRYGFPSTVVWEAELVGTEPDLHVSIEGTMAYASLTGMFLTGTSIRRTAEMYMEDQAGDLP